MRPQHALERPQDRHLVVDEEDALPVAARDLRGRGRGLGERPEHGGEVQVEGRAGVGLAALVRVVDGPAVRLAVRSGGLATVTGATCVAEA
jgi:hypothetical protein